MDDSVPESRIELAPEENTGGSGKLPLIALIVGAVGVAFGVAGMYMGNQAGRKAEAVVADVEARLSATAEVQAQVADIEERLVSLGKEFVRLDRKDREIQTQTQAGFDSVMRELRTTREAMSAQATAVNETLAKVESMASRPRASTAAATPAATSGTGSTASGDAAPTAATPDDGVYTIQSGDTFSKIASRLGISLDALMRANPGVNPSRLQIGQKIVLPKP